MGRYNPGVVKLTSSKSLSRSASMLLLFGNVVMAQTNDDLALVGGTIYPDPTEAPIRDGVVLIRSGEIVAVGGRGAVAIPDGARSLDCSGATITAGFWNSHVHFFERKWADAANIPAPELERQLQESFTRFGFTSVFDTGSNWKNTRALRGRVESGEVAGPRIRSTGEAMVAPNAVPSDRILAVLGIAPFPGPEVAEAAQAADAASSFLDDGVDGIKLHLQPPPAPNPPFPEAGMTAAVEIARQRGKPVFVHPHTGADVKAAADAGVDVIAHTTPGSGPWDEATLAAMRDANVALTPTLTLWSFFMRHDRASVRDHMTQTAVSQLRAWSSAGGTVLFGTDHGAVDPDPGEEYALMADAGMSVSQILASLTTAPAARFGESERSGRIAVGHRADLVVLNEDPSENLGALAFVRYTLRAGTVVYRASE